MSVLHPGVQNRAPLRESGRYGAGWRVIRRLHPFELFRANEKINADKRHWLAQETNRLLTRWKKARLGRDIMLVVKSHCHDAGGAEQVIIYEYPLPTSSPLEKEEAPGVNFIIDDD
jgi:hypothetical protein